MASSVHHEALGAFQFRSRKRLTGVVLGWVSTPVWFMMVLSLWQDGMAVMAALLGSFWVLWLIYSTADAVYSHIEVYYKGLLYRRLGRGWQTIAFHADMRFFVHRWQYGWSLFTFGKQVKLRFEMADKCYVIPHSFAQGERMVAVIEHYQFVHTLPLFHQAYEAGHTMDLGAMQWSRSTIQVGKRCLLRKQVGKVVLSDGKLRFHVLNEKGKSKYFAAAKVPVHKIANVGILCRLLGFTQQDMLKYAYDVRRLPFL